MGFLDKAVGIVKGWTPVSLLPSNGQAGRDVVWSPNKNHYLNFRQKYIIQSTFIFN